MKLRQLFENMILQEAMNYAEMFNRMLNTFQDLRMTSETADEDEYWLSTFNFESSQVDSFIAKIRKTMDPVAHLWSVQHQNYYMVWMIRLSILGLLLTQRNRFSAIFNFNIKQHRIAEIMSRLEEEIQRVDSKFENSAINYVDRNAITTMISEMEHYLSLPIDEIQEFRFRNQSPEAVFSYFGELESIWKKTTERMIPIEKVADTTEKIIDFGDGFAWYDVHDTWCSVDAQSMGHCGNSPQRHDANQNVYSLRETVQIKSKTFILPHATFIFHKKEGVFGEMKGVGNNKPEAAHHHYILELIMQPWVNGLVGGGYEPENNFSIKDVAGWQQYVEKKPKLLPLDKYIETFGVDNYIDNLFYLTFHTAENEKQQEFATKQQITVPLFSSSSQAEVSMILNDELKLSDHYMDVEGDSLYRGIAPFNFLKKLGVIPSDFPYPHDTITSAERDELVDMIDMEFKNMIREGLEKYARNSEYFVRNIWLNYDGRVSYDYGSDAIYGTLEIPSRNLDSIEIDVDEQNIIFSVSKQDIIQRILNHEDSFTGHHKFEISLYMDAGRLDDDIIEWAASIYTLSELFRVSHIAPNATSRMTYFVLNMFTDQTKYDWDTKR
jgi:hypothetical protein